MSPAAKMDYEADILEVLRAPQKTKLKKGTKKARKNEQVKGKLQVENLLTTSIKGDPLDNIEYEKRDTTITGTDGTVIFELKGAEVPKQWSRVASDVAVSKYFRKAGVPQPGKGNKLGGETSIKQVVRRITGCWRYWGEKYNYFENKKSAQAYEDEMKYILINQLGAPNSPQWFNTGLAWAYNITGPAQGHVYVDPETNKIEKSKDAYTRPQPHACFIQSVSDDLVNEGGIMDLITREARVFKYGSGSGTNFSSLRGEGEPLSGGGKSSGLMSWLKILDRSAGAIKSGGTTRRAAKMACLDIDHPDVEQFINWKKEEEKKVAALIAAGYDSDFNGEAYQTVSGQNANNSIRVTADFMEALKKNENWHLRWRTNKSHISKTVAARDLWMQIADAAWHSADPGLQYDTTINEWHTASASGRINASNPCSEYMFLDDTACNLASVNLVKFYNAKTGVFDIETFKHVVRLWTITLEISILMAQFVSNAIARNSYDFRTLGLGYANLGTLLMMMGLPYDSEQGRAIAASISAIMTAEAYTTSAEMAKHLGPFARFKENREGMLRVIRNHRRAAYSAPQKEYEDLTIKPLSLDAQITPGYLLKAARSSWDEALSLGEQYGYRNAQVTLIAPTGTIGLVMDCDTTGIEPDFALVKFKKLAGGGYWKIINHSVPGALKQLGYSAEEIKEILDYAVGTATLKNAPHINHESLIQKGLSSADIEKIEKQLPMVFELGFAFNYNTLGEETMKRLNLSPNEYQAPGFNMLRALDFTQEQIDEANEFVCGTMTLEGAPHLKERDLAVFDCANRCGSKGTRLIATMGHIKMMAAVQPFLSGAISKTINLPNEATVEDIADAYLQGWLLGLKANALYRDGSKLSQPLSTKSDKEEGEEKETTPPQYTPQRIRPPRERQSITRKVAIGGHKIYLTVGLYPDGKPAEIFFNMAQEGSFASGMADAFAKVASIGLQYGVPIQTIIKQLEYMRFDPNGFTGDPDIPFATSVADFTAQWLKKTFVDKDGGVTAKISLPLAGNGTESKDSAATGEEREKEKDKESASNQTTIFASEMNAADQAASSALGSLGVPCPDCGAIMTPNGRCHKCPNCGATTGCS
ncbi:MAG TPA: vitamin B12-dependent ribonucleotide reductase [bacterium]|nr:vitamin B12-dependent ribonucleotide reductase [bacterium]HOR57077.1 vitamin B12-dependent ribonucleotide reductase [bacterium]